MSAPPDRVRRYAEWLAGVAPHAREMRSFEAVLTARVPYAGDPARQLEEMRERFTSVYLDTMRPFLMRAERCRFYGFDDLDREPPVYREMPPVPTPERPERWRAEYVRRARGGIDANLTAAGILDDIDFWWWVVAGATPVIIIDRGALNPDADFASFGDPRVIGNPGASKPRAALTFARRESSSGERVAVLVGASEVSIIAEPEEAIRLLEAIIAFGRLSPEFERWYGTYRVEPLDIGGYDLWIKLNSTHNDWSVLLAALDGATLAGDERRAVLDALVAAELVAALSGRPPASYGDSEPRRALGLAAWVARLAPTNPLGPDVRDKARRVVERIAVHSSLPEQLWRTEEPRALWRAAMTGLANRLR